MPAPEWVQELRAARRALIEERRAAKEPAVDEQPTDTSARP